MKKLNIRIQNVIEEITVQSNVYVSLYQICSFNLCNFLLFCLQFFTNILNLILKQNVSYHTFQGYCSYVERYCQRNRRHL